MAASPKNSLQKAAFAVLTGNAFQAACGVPVGVYDKVPANAVAPYVVIGDIQTDGAQADNYDPSDLHANWMVWSVKPGKVELETIAHQVRLFLSPASRAVPPFVLDGHRLVTWIYRQTIPVDDTDGISVKAVVKAEYQTEPLPS